MPGPAESGRRPVEAAVDSVVDPPDAEAMSGRSRDPEVTSSRRTEIVRVLDGMEGRVTVDELVNALRRTRERRGARSGDATTWADRHERLHDEDLPALDEAGLLEFDEARGVVFRHGDAAGRRAARSAPVVGADRAGESGAESDGGVGVEGALLGLAVVSAGVLAATAVGAGPFARLSTTAVSTAVAVVYIVGSVAAAARQ